MDRILHRNNESLIFSFCLISLLVTINSAFKLLELLLLAYLLLTLENGLRILHEVLRPLLFQLLVDLLGDKHLFLLGMSYI